MSDQTKAARIEAYKAWISKQPDRTCRGAQNQNVGEVLKKIERQASEAERRAQREKSFGRAQQLVETAERWRELIPLVTQVAEALESGERGETFASIDAEFFADQPRDGDEGRVRTGRVINILIALGLTAEAGALDNVARATCGLNLNELIYGQPEDGEVHYFVCPSCKLEHSVRRVPAAPAEAEGEPAEAEA